MLEHPDILVMAWGATVPMMAHAVGIELDKITTTRDKWVTDTPITTAKGVIGPGKVAAINFTINGIYRGETRIQLQHVNRIGPDAARVGHPARPAPHPRGRDHPVRPTAAVS